MTYDTITDSYVIAKREFKIVATTSDKVDSIPIKDGQLIFVQNEGRIAFDFNSERVSYSTDSTIDKAYIDVAKEEAIKSAKEYTDAEFAKVQFEEVVEF